MITDMDEARKYGRAIAWGFLDVIAFVCIGAVALMFISGPDSTDESRWRRSGIRPHIDQATGLHYLSAPSGGITPRLNADGAQMREPR